MAKVGYISMIIGILTLLGYALYSMLIAMEVPLLMKLAILLLAFGVGLILIKQLFDRRHEKKEEDDYKKY